MKKIKVLVTATTFPRWANDPQPPFVKILSKRLAEFFSMSVLCPYAKGAKEFEEDAGLSIYRYKYLPFGLGTLAYDGGIVPKLKQNKLNYLQIPSFILAQFVKVSQLVKLLSIDVIHAHWIIPQGLVAVLYKILINNKVKILATSHGGDILGFQGSIGTALKRFVLRRIDRLTVVSNALRDEAIRYGCTCDIHVSPMGVDTRTFNPDRRNNSIKDEYGIVGPFLLFVGRLVEKKGVEHLVRAMPMVLASHPSARLLIVGNGPLKKQLEELSCDLGLQEAIIFAGSKQHDQLPAYFASADIFIGPSIITKSGDSEGFGLVFAEAMSCGTPVIASDLPAVRDIVVEGETGFLVRQKDPEHIAERILTVLGKVNALDDMHKAARKHVEDNFDWDVVTRRYVDIINTMWSM
jgi:glycosyltransferase involved in cell wall biosynthesis